ncbi:MAG: diguanylate cyclase [Pelosinus sp.]|nr:diguanylate cyclase [Pelosinus sp.]
MMMSGIIKTPKQLRHRYLLALSIIALLLLISQVLIQYSLSEQLGDARVINIAGRQRMLSQRISKCVLLLQGTLSPQERAAHKQELAESIALWRKSNHSLQYGDSGIGLLGRKSPTITAMFTRNQPHFEAMAQAAEKLLEDTLSPAERQALVDLVMRQQAVFLQGMDEIVFQYDAEARWKVIITKRLEVAIMLITGITLLLEARFIFYPLETKLQKSLHDYQESQTRLVRFACFDQLTGVYNRRHFLEEFQNKLLLAKQRQQIAVIAYLDLDGLKSVNDEYGHHEGDWYISCAATVMVQNMRERDIIGRLGGDEFAIVLENCSPEVAQATLQQMTLALQNKGKEYHKPYNMSFSAGIIAYNGEEEVETLLQNADSIMYRQKQQRKMNVPNCPLV